jgi:serine/threonine protein kinase
VAQNSPAVAVAVKTFDIRDDAASEVRNLKLLKQSLNTNNSIALHLGLIDHASQYLIIFQRAMFGDLWQFIYCGNPPDDTERRNHAYTFKDRFPGAVKGVDITSALLEQCRDLALALKFLHTPRSIVGAMTFCAHMDLKPDNILIYDAGPSKPVGQWKICDFGISAFKEDEDEEPAPSGSIGDLYSIATLRMRPKRNEGSYQPPEVDTLAMMPIPTAKDPRRIGRKGDIWSFGAIFAEVLSFAMERDTYVKEFREERVKDCSATPANDRFYCPVTRPRPSPIHLLPVPPAPTAVPTEREFQLRPAVATWLEKVAREASAPRQSIDCWAEVVMQILKVNANERPKAPRLAEMVEHVYQHTLKANQSKEIGCEFVDPKIPKPNRPISVQPPTPDLPSNPNPSSPRDHPTPKVEMEYKNPRVTQGKPGPVMSPDLKEDLTVTPSRQGSENPRRHSSPSSMLGKPFNAYGIKYNEDRRRRQSPPNPDDYAEVHKVHPPPRGAHAVSVDYVFQDGLRAAYLFKDTVSIYCIGREGDAVPPTPTSIVLDKTSRCTWSGVALAGEYLAVWGKKKSDETTRVSPVRRLPDGAQLG